MRSFRRHDVGQCCVLLLQMLCSSICRAGATRKSMPSFRKWVGQDQSHPMEPRGKETHASPACTSSQSQRCSDDSPDAGTCISKGASRRVTPPQRQSAGQNRSGAVATLSAAITEHSTDHAFVKNHTVTVRHRPTLSQTSFHGVSSSNRGDGCAMKRLLVPAKP